MSKFSDDKNVRIKKRTKTKVIISSILIGISIILSLAARMCQDFAQWYSTHIYPVWVETVGRAMGYFPFSISEVLLYLMILIFLVSGAQLLIRRIRKKLKKEEGYGWLCNVFLAVGVLFFLYVVNCGVNYHRDSFSETSGIQADEYSIEELKEVCVWLTEEVNQYSNAVERNQEGTMELEVSTEEQAVTAMQKLGETYPELKGYYPKPKGLLNSWILSIQNLSGVYSPFTIEANYNQAMTDYNIPFTICHELSHLRGFMQEQEANFIAFLACRESEEATFQYSGNMLGWIHCMNVLYKVDYDAWEEVRGELSTEAETDLQANHEFWARYDGTVAEVSNKVNDTYLKANGQKDGVKSYNRMVDLIVAYKRDRVN